jgi:hypothetical protein
MNDSRRHPTTVHARLLLAPAVLALASCGSSGGGTSSTSTSEPHENAQLTTQAAGPLEHLAPGEQLTRADESNPGDDRGYPARPFFCSRDPVAFDLSRLNLAGGTPQGFAQAWTYARARSQLPGFVVAYSGTVAGPTLDVRVGAVRKVTNGIYAFMKTVTLTEVVHAGLEQFDPYHVRTQHRGMFVTAFGDTHRREGFIVSSITVDGHLDEACRALHDIKVTMTLPLQNREQRFGDVLLGDVLGAPNTSDHEGKEGWRIDLTGDYLENMMFSI